MFALAFESACRSILKTPGVSVLVVLAIALGVGITMPMVALYQNNSGNPISEISDNIYRVSIDNWKSDEPFHSRLPDMPTEILNVRDTRALVASDIPSDYTASYDLNVWVRSTDNKTKTKPFYGAVRVTNNGFFRMFDVPMAHGSYWSDEQAKDRSNVAVISRMTNVRLFGGGDSVGESFKVANETYTVVGVLGDWSPTPRVYDLSQSNGRPEGIYVPLSNFSRSELGPELRWQVSNSNVPTDFDTAFLASETIFVTLWVKLDSASEAAAYRSFMDSYLQDQKRLGRLPSLIENRLDSATNWLEISPSQQDTQRLYRVFVIVGVLFLMVCLFNLLSLLLGKFMSVTPEACVVRALGASRMMIFTQYVTEVVLLGLIGGILSLAIAKAGLAGMLWIYLENIPPEFKLIASPDGESAYTRFDARLLLISLLLAVSAAVLCALYPAWRACRIPPAEYLKMN
jgi:putative ABC transport system permease protein